MLDQSNNIVPYDLHVHTYWSYDATAEVAEYFQAAEALGVRCIAITEHHHMDSAGQIEANRDRYPSVHAIPAAEFSVTSSIGSIDLLCYNLPWRPTGRLAALIDSYHEWQRRTGAAVSAGMQAIGHDYTDDDRLSLVQQYRPQEAIDRQGATHVKTQVQQAHFLKCGYITDQNDYRSLLQKARAAAPGPDYPAVETVVSAVHEAGGLVVLAHPQGYFHGNDRKRMDALREECQLDGIECAHPSVEPELTALYERYCREHGLLACGGSDCHSTQDIEHRFARHGGKTIWLEEMLERMEGSYTQ